MAVVISMVDNVFTLACDVSRLKYIMLDYARKWTNHTLSYLACEHVVLGVRQVQQKNGGIRAKATHEGFVHIA